MHAKYVQRVVCAKQFLQTIHAPQAGKARQETDDQGAADTDIAGSGCYSHQTSHSTRGCTQHGSLATHQRFTNAPGQHGSSSRTKGVDKGQRSEAIGFQGGTCVETKPAHPQQGRAHHGQSQAVRGHGFFAVTDALAHHVGAHQASHSGVDVHHSAASKVQRAGLPQVTCFGVHGVHHFFAGVGVRSHPEPDHVGNRGVAESEPQHHESQHGGELHAFGKSAHDQGAGDAGKRGLEGSEHDLRNDHALAEGGRVGKSASHVVPNALHEQAVPATKEGAAFGERQAVAVNKPQHHDHREGDHDLHEH